MIKLLFVCHGNICRSPMAEFVMKDILKKVGLEKEFQISSAATSTEEIGHPVYPPARRKLAEHGIRCDGHSTRQLTNRDYEEYDFLIGMDQANLYNMYRICGRDYAGKMHRLDHYGCNYAVNERGVIDGLSGSPGRNFGNRTCRRAYMFSDRIVLWTYHFI